MNIIQEMEDWEKMQEPKKREGVTMWVHYHDYITLQRFYEEREKRFPSPIGKFKKQP